MPLSLQEKFDKAVAFVQSLPKDGPVQLEDTQKLTFYKYYKQVIEGDVNTPRPGLFDFVGKAKWDAWKSVEGVSKEEAQRAYVKALIEILDRKTHVDLIAELEVE
ncbi:acyl-CoA-binding protein [Scleroderma yunnanense]